MTVSDSDCRRSEPASTVADRAPRIWALWAAARPSHLALIVLVYTLGVGMATAGPPLIASGSFAAPVVTEPAAFLEPVLVGAIALIPVSVTIHYANEYVDVETDARTVRTPFSGGSGALDRTGLSPSFLKSAMVASFVLTVLAFCGVAAFGLPWDALGILVSILVLGLAYSLSPFVLVRRGVGEFVNAALGGLLLPLYGIAVVATPRPVATLAVVPFALVVGCNLLATHWPDRNADAAVGKRTLVVRWSPASIRRAYVGLAITALLVAFVLWRGGIFPDAVALAHLAPVPLLLWGGIVLTRQRSPLPSVAAMVALATSATISWWWVGIVA